MNEATAGVALAESAPSPEAFWRAAPRNVPAAFGRLGGHKLPEPLIVPGLRPLIETVPAPDFTVMAEITVNHGPIGAIALTPGGSELLVTNHAADTVSVIDTGSLAVVQTIPAINEPFALAATDNGAYVSSVSAAYDTIALIDSNTNAVVASHPVADSVRDLVASRDGKHIYASRIGRDGADVAAIDSAGDPVATIDVASGAGASAGAMAISPDGLRLYVATMDEFDNDLVVVDTDENRVVAAIMIGSPIRAVALTDDGDTAYVLSCNPELGGSIDAIDTATNEITATRAIGGSPTQLALSSDGSRAYAVLEDRVTVLCTATNEVIDAVTVGAQPSFVTESPDGNRLYVADYSGGVTVLSVAAAPVSLLARMLALDFG